MRCCVKKTTQLQCVQQIPAAAENIYAKWMVGETMLGNSACVDQSRPLEGLAVLDLTQALSGPICTCILADYGAKVIKVESPSKADMTRAKNYDPALPIDADTGGDNFYAINRNKYGICVDNRSEEGKKILKALAAKVDVVISNYRPGVTKKIGIDYDSLKALNPGLICCEISAFRERERVNEPAFDVVVQAASGILASTGYPDEPPAKVGASVTDITAGLNAVQGILLALLERHRTGMGQLVSVKMQDAAMFLLAQYVTPCILDRRFDLQRSGMCHVEATPSNGYQTTDGYILITPATDSLFRAFSAAIGMPELGEDARFTSGAARYKYREALDEIIKPVLRTRSTDEWYRVFKEAGIPASPICTPKQAFQKAYEEQSPIVATVQHPVRGPMPVIGTVCDLSRTPGAVTRRAPIFGENTREVLRELLDMPDSQISALAADGVIKCYEGPLC